MSDEIRMASATATSYNIYQDVNTVATGVTGTTYTVEELKAGRNPW